MILKDSATDPIALIGRHHSCPKLTEAVRDALEQNGLKPVLPTPTARNRTADCPRPPPET